MFTRAEMNLHIMKSGKRIANKNHHSVPTGLRKATAFLKDEYLKDIQCTSDQSCFYFRAKCFHSFRKNDPPHDIKIALNILSGEVGCATCSCVAGKASSGVKTTDLCQEDDQTSVAACTSQLQKWHRKRGGSNITPEPVMDVEVKKIKLDNTTSKPGVKSLLYEARVNTNHDFIAEQKLKEDLAAINANMGFAQMVTKVGSHLGGNINTVDTKFGKCQIGSLLSYQVGFTESNFTATADIFIIPRQSNNFNQPLTYPRFPLRCEEKQNFPKNLVDEEKTLISYIEVDEMKVNKIERETIQQANCAKWKVERTYRFTASSFHLISRLCRPGKLQALRPR